MRRAIIFLILLAIMFGIAFAVYSAYSNHVEIADFNELTSNSRKLDSNGNYFARFKYNKEGYYIKSFEYDVVDDDLYITIFVSVGKNDNEDEVDEDGYTIIEISGLPDNIDKVYYKNEDKKSVLPTDRD